MQLNTARQYNAKTHGGAPAFPHLTPIQQLQRSVLSCLLWENQFYESGQDIGSRIEDLAAKVSVEELAALAIEARSIHNLRHIPLLLLVALAKHGGSIVSETIASVIQRPDELTEFLAIYWRNGKIPISKQVKKGLAKAFTKFDAYRLAKYNRDGAIKLRDVLFMVHAKPKNETQEKIWKQLIDGTLPAPDTWEVELSAGNDKRKTFERLLRENKMGYLALLRNLRNMVESHVDIGLIHEAISSRKGANHVLPFRYVAAARACLQLEPVLDDALSKTISELPILKGKTVILVDVSYSMRDKLSRKSNLTRMDAAATLASLIRGDLRIFTFSNGIVEVPPRRGMAGIDTIIHSQRHSGTDMAGAIAAINAHILYDRIIVITDEQATTGRIPNPISKLAYMINVASYKNGIGYGAWTHIDGFSENALRWIIEIENDA